MGLKPYEKRMADIFGSNQYAIDFYQREYKWNDDEQEYKPVKSLLDDIFYRFQLEYKPELDITDKNIVNLEWYYLSSYMTNEVDGKVFIVDGQQRLTTLTLIIIKLYHMSLDKKLNESVSEYLKKSICDTTLRGEVFWMGFVDRINALKDVFKNDIEIKGTHKNISEKNIYANYQAIHKILSENLKEPHKLEFFINYLVYRIYLIEIKIDKPKDVAMVFEVINDRGIPLRAFEILKGKLLGQISKTDIDAYVSIWDKYVNKLEEYSEDDVDFFFSSYLRAKFADSSDQFKKLEQDKYHRTIFLDEWNKKIGFKHNEKNIKAYVKNKLGYYVDVYCDINKHYYNYSKNYEHIYFNKMNDLDRQYHMILSAISENDKDRDSKINTVARLFDKYYVILNLTGCYNSNTFSESMIKLISAIRDKSIVDIIKQFDDSLLEDVKKIKYRDKITSPFRYEFFKTLGYTDFSKRFLRYFFSRVEHFISENSKLPCSSYYQLVEQGKGQDVHHIEHILANRKENIAIFADEDEFNAERNRLGALLLIKGPDNQSSSDELYKQKLKTYSGNGTLLAQTLRKDFYKSNKGFDAFKSTYSLDFKWHDTFGKNEIELRHKLLYQIAKLIWS